AAGPPPGAAEVATEPTTGEGDRLPDAGCGRQTVAAVDCGRPGPADGPAALLPVAGGRERSRARSDRGLLAAPVDHGGRHLAGGVALPSHDADGPRAPRGPWVRLGGDSAGRRRGEAAEDRLAHPLG